MRKAEALADDIDAAASNLTKSALGAAGH